MTWSLNELEAMSRKAARGCGLSWGLAEEAGRASRWLAEHGLPAPRLLADLLVQNDGVAYGDLVPDCGAEPWSAHAGRLCPLIAGAALSDRLQAIAPGEAIRLGRCAVPVLLLPALANGPETYVVAWDGVSVGVGPDRVTVDGSAEALSLRETDSVKIRRGEAAKGRTLPEKARCDIEPDAIEVLQRFAHRTYAPATEESRAAGAGAGLTDND
ncbi:DUF3726 domain-containing protein [Defluviimonas aestuarii]|uniref:DUF3726 domain-containing protein n=1 Tax=Albidovulum aestuarii TaxID=1130726 RepID=UPI00249B8B85|nr:DUF3726 domain-containing protein [Defluviimonas aestuarii]MDI3336693.1 DUF3726 domain-containing protein [Defluviimonas aestuarii]